MAALLILSADPNVLGLSSLQSNSGEGNQGWVQRCLGHTRTRPALSTSRSCCFAFAVLHKSFLPTHPVRPQGRNGESQSTPDRALLGITSACSQRQAEDAFPQLARIFINLLHPSIISSQVVMGFVPHPSRAARSHVHPGASPLVKL